MGGWRAAPGPAGTGTAPRFPGLLPGAPDTVEKGKGGRGRGRRKGCLNHTHYTATRTVSCSRPRARSTPSAGTRVPVERPPAERYTHTSPAPLVPARASKEISALHLLYPFLPPHSPHGVSLSPWCTPGLPSPPQQWVSLTGNRRGACLPTSRGAGNVMQSGSVPHVPIQQAGKRSDILTMFGVIASQIKPEAPKSVTAKPIL